MPALILSLLLIGAGCAAKEPVGTSPSPSPSVAPTSSSTMPPSPTHSTGPEDVPSPSAVPSASPSVDPSRSPSAAPSAVPSAKPSPSASGGTTDFSSPGYALMEEESLGGLHYRMSESALITLLGEPESKSETLNWGADGLDHTDWNYPSLGLEVNMAKLPDDVEASVFMITATAPCGLATERGIRLGDTKDAVLKAYAKEYNAADSDDNSLVLGTVYGGIIVYLENGIVTRIFIGAAAE